jgi:hypothetical protein
VDAGDDVTYAILVIAVAAALVVVSSVWYLIRRRSRD